MVWYRGYEGPPQRTQLGRVTHTDRVAEKTTPYSSPKLDYMDRALSPHSYTNIASSVETVACVLVEG